jgi:uroporphyrin-3 C-methyltransferase
MSDKDTDEAPPAEEEAVEATPPVEQDAAEDNRSSERDTPDGSRPARQETAREAPTRPKRGATSIVWLSFVVAILALALAGYVAWQNRLAKQDTAMQDRLAGLESRVTGSADSMGGLESRIDELSRRDPGVDAGELDALRREFDERVRLLSSLPARISTLESSLASLAGVSEGARDAWVLAEAEYYMQIANAQLQLASNPHLATLALRMADERIVQLANPGLTDVRRALSDELAALELMDKPDIEGATLTLASLARVVEALPLASEALPEDETDDGVDPELSGAGRAWASLKNAMSGLVKVTPPEHARLALLTPDGELFLRSNLALQLQSARLALLRGEQAIFEQSLDDTSALLRGYFDLDSTQVAATLETIAEVRDQVFTTDMPDISGSLELLRQFRALHENAR